MKSLIIVFFVLFVFQSVHAQYIPPHREGVSQADYDKWVRRIKSYHKTLNDKEIYLKPRNEVTILINYSTAYYHLKEPTDSSYLYLEKMLKIDKKEACIAFEGYNENALFFSNLPLYDRMSRVQWETLTQDCNGILLDKEQERAAKLAAEYEANKDIYNFELMEQLAKIREKDSFIRKEWTKIEKTYDKNSPEYTAYTKKVQEQDDLNLAEVEAIIKKYGYPGKSLVGSEHQIDAILVLHHTKENAVREKYFPMLYEAAQKEEISRSFFKLYIDRLHQIHFGTQLYGTQSQYNSETKAYEKVPIEAPENQKQRLEDYNNGIIDIGRLSF